MTIIIFRLLKMNSISQNNKNFNLHPKPNLIESIFQYEYLKYK